MTHFLLYVQCWRDLLPLRNKFLTLQLVDKYSRDANGTKGTKRLIRVVRRGKFRCSHVLCCRAV
jgi:hypothetical protein